MKSALTRRWAALGVAAGLALSLAACSSADSGSTGSSSAAAAPSSAAAPVTSSAAEPVTITLTWWGGDARHERTQQVIDAFEAKYPNITVEPEYTDWNGYWDRLATETAGGNSPDVIQMDMMYLASYAGRGALYDLSSVSSLDLTTLDSTLLGMGTYDGGQYAIPMSATSWAILVNTDLLGQLGLSLPDTETWTWDEFEDFALSITTASGGTVHGTGPQINAYSLDLWARAHGDATFSGGDITIKPETVASYFQLALDWSKSGAMPTAEQYAETATAALDQSDFALGKLAMIFTQSTQGAAYAQAANANVQLVKIPTDDANSTKYAYLKPGMYWSISSQTKHPEEAGLLINFIENDPAAAAILGTERGIPANPAMVDAIQGSLTDAEKQAVAYAESLASVIGPAPEITPNGASAIDTALTRYLQDVLFETSTPLVAAQAFIDEIHQGIEAAQ
ncbi:MAG: extracellular solute-binding protein [Propionibacteriaceae bacterium]|jgi:multiple sugar transport system substrate-binding protein|nr:extracellular solute-binding protein [Propionibacteriaceae bacterium]